MADHDQADIQEALEAYEAFKAHKQQAQQVKPDGADKAAHPSQPTVPQDQPSDLMKYLSKGATMMNALHAYPLKGITNNWVDPGKLPVVGSSIEYAKKDSPVSAAIGETLGGGALGAAEGMATAGLMPGGSKVLPALGRVGVNTAVGAAHGLLRKPEGDETHLGNAWSGAKTAGLTSAGVELGAQALRPLSWGAKKLGAWLGKLSPAEAEAYSKDPKGAEVLYDMEKNRPYEFDQMAKEKLSGASDALQGNYIDPRKVEISRRGVGASYQVTPSQYENTEAYPVIKDAWNKQGKTVDLDVPVYEPYKAQASPVEEHLNYGKPSTQNVYTSDPYTPGKADVSEISHSLQKAGEPVTVSEGLLPRGNQSVSVPAPMPDRVSLGTEPMLRAKRASGAASDIAYKSNPMGLSPADTEVAKANSEAATSLGKAIKAQDDKIPLLDDELHEALRQKESIERLGNPSRIFQAGDSPSNVPIRSTRQYLDEKTGSDLQNTANSLFAARALNGPMNTVEGAYSKAALSPIAAKHLLKASGLTDLYRGGAQSPETAQGIEAMLQSLFSGSNSSSK